LGTLNYYCLAPLWDYGAYLLLHSENSPYIHASSLSACSLSVVAIAADTHHILCYRSGQMSIFTNSYKSHYLGTMKLDSEFS